MLSRLSISTYTAVLVAAVTVGVLVRAFHVLSSDFPLNDGGLFYQMTRDLQDASYALPAFTSYNGGGIPFSYPPLGFYVTGMIDSLTPLSLIDAYRFVPLVVTCLTMPAFYLLARSLLPSRVAVAASVVAFALIPRTYTWLLMGGGVTRSFGLLFAILAMYCVVRVYRDGRFSAVLPASVFAGLTVLSHLETAWFLAFTCLLLFVAYGRSRQGIGNSALIGAGTLAIAMPWLLSVLLQHGLEPFVVVSGSGGSVFSGGEATRAAYMGLLSFAPTSEPMFPLWGALALVGAIVTLSSRRFFLTAWFAAIVLLDVRAFPTFTTLPLAMLAGVAVGEVLLPFLRRATAEAEETQPAPGRNALRVSMPAVVVGVLLVYATAAALLRADGMGGEAHYLKGLSQDERTALSWVADQAPPGSAFLLIPDGSWETAKTAEWFSVLTGHYSVATVQGTEWLSGNGFERMRATYDYAHECGYRTTVCLQELAKERGVQFSHVYIRKGDGGGQCCATLAGSLASDGAYALAYDGPGATVYELRLGDAVNSPVQR
jgi:hypothetical protein